MLSNERVDSVYREVWSTVAHPKRLGAFARAIEREATAPLIEQIKQLSDQADRSVSVAEGLIEQIKEDEALMARALASLDDYKDGAEWGAYDLEILTALRQRMEARK